MVDKVQEIPRSYEIVPLGTLFQVHVCLVHLLVERHDGLRQLLMPQSILLVSRSRTIAGTCVLANQHTSCKICCNLQKRFLWPITKPVDYAAIEQRRAGVGAVVEIGVGRIHCEDDVQVSLNSLCEARKYFGVIHAGDICSSAFMDQGRMLIPLEKSRYFARCEQRVHSLDECWAQCVGLVEDEGDLFTLDPGTLHDYPNISLEGEDVVVAANLQGVDAKTIQPGDKLRQYCLAGTRSADE
mmetsp:Transcript_20847/g.49452  ORF Transcript_20847/g.49452 Transcript_20847/m.49452 type:complete len:241 (+) Transcript_20847:4593-5315(+)